MKRKESVAELKGMTVQDLQSRARSIGEELMKLRFRKAAGQLEQSHRVKDLKKTLARVLTYVSAKSGTASSESGVKS